MEEERNPSPNAIANLPVGFRFLPTDEELLVHYLRKKATSSTPFPGSSLIPELDVFLTDPWNLPGDQGEKRHFFGRKIAGRSERIATGSGYWRMTGRTKRIPGICGRVRVEGTRRTLAFRNRRLDRRDGLVVSRWMVHEITLAGREGPGDWAVYRLFRKTVRHSRKRVTAVPVGSPGLSPCSSTITELSWAGELDGEEISSKHASSL
ncbi:hypothetical protein MLD38_022741 [Melastoma candidum]|uniref:Uncharacterized protein n=1 Tax=Melastoma candidum TaxID=119954 RepID=A0ACB9QK52_9MYRT|nr:hypothetical protein MLD38_022741 [Melastoma candidum]